MSSFKQKDAKGRRNSSPHATPSKSTLKEADPDTAVKQESEQKEEPKKQTVANWADRKIKKSPPNFIQVNKERVRSPERVRPTTDFTEDESIKMHELASSCKIEDYLE